MATRLPLEIAFEPIVATCTRCGAEGLILPLPAPRGSFQCPNCTVPASAHAALLRALDDLRRASS